MSGQRSPAQEHSGPLCELGLVACCLKTAFVRGSPHTFLGCVSGSGTDAIYKLATFLRRHRPSWPNCLLTELVNGSFSSMYKNILVFPILKEEENIKNLEKKYMIMYTFTINHRGLGEENSTCLNLSKILSLKLDTKEKKNHFGLIPFSKCVGPSCPPKDPV